MNTNIDMSPKKKMKVDSKDPKEAIVLSNDVTISGQVSKNLSNQDPQPQSSSSSSSSSIVVESIISNNIEDIEDEDIQDVEVIDVEGDDSIEVVFDNKKIKVSDIKQIFNDNRKASNEDVALHFYTEWFNMENAAVKNNIIIEEFSQQYFIGYVSEMVSSNQSFFTVIFDFLNYNEKIQKRITNDSKETKYVLSTVKQIMKRKMELMILTCMYLFLTYMNPNEWENKITIIRNTKWLSNIYTFYENKIKNILSNNDYLFMNKVVTFFMIEYKDREFFNKKKSYQLFINYGNLNNVDNILSEIRNDKNKKLMLNNSQLQFAQSITTANILNEMRNDNNELRPMETTIETSITNAEVEESIPITSTYESVKAKPIVHTKKSFIVRDPDSKSYTNNSKYEVSLHYKNKLSLKRYILFRLLIKRLNITQELIFLSKKMFECTKWRLEVKR